MAQTRPQVALLRAVHALFAVYFIACLAYMFYAAFARAHGWPLTVAMLSLALEGAVVALNRGQYPLTAIQRRAGDEKGFFNLFMPDALARRMVPFWFALALVAYLLVWLRW